MEKVIAGGIEKQLAQIHERKVLLVKPKLFLRQGKPPS